ncbi:MAG: hypothetical protein HOP28_10165, partial [Gemmatimonadales bacterium]|nr:hypothetical protein [Gemmatimonadales bacterium]
AGLHPAAPAIFTNPTALSWRDSLFSGLDRWLVPNSGYGKAPMIKYIVDRWGADKVRQIWTDIRTGATPIAALLMNVPEPPAIWWPNLLQQHLQVGIYPWSVDRRVPENTAGSPFTYPFDVKMGTASSTTPNTHPFYTEFDFLRRDTSRFGPKYRLPVFLDASSIGKGRLLAFKKGVGAPGYEFLGSGDTVFFPGALLQSRDTALLLITQVDPHAPYTGHSQLDYTIDLSIPDGDWRITGFRGLADHIAFACDVPGNSVTLNVEDNAKSVFNLLATGGSFNKVPGVGLVSYDWISTPAYADSLRKYKLNVYGSLTLVNETTVRVDAGLDFDWTSTAATAAAASGARISWFWLLLPLGGIPLFFRGRRRGQAALAAVVAAFVVVGCEIGQLEYAMDESFEYTFTEVRFTADPANPAAPLMELKDGAGESTLHRFLSAYWVYTKDATGAVVDSVKRTCTGTGSATYKVDLTEHKDGVTPAAAPAIADLRFAPERLFPMVRGQR